MDPFEHRIQLARDLGIPEANDAISRLLQPKLSLPIALKRLVEIPPSVQHSPSLRGALATKQSNSLYFPWRDGLLRCARNDADGALPNLDKRCHAR
jgi:hypothetical protein